MGEFNIGLVIGFVIAWITLIFAAGGDATKYRTAITQCEANLPRNQHCEIYARPKETEHDKE